MADILGIMIITIPLFWILSIICTMVAAYHRGRIVGAWFALGFLLGFFALIMVLVSKPNQTELDNRALEKGEMKLCDTCAELVKPKAQKCRYCGEAFGEPTEIVEGMG